MLTSIRRFCQSGSCATFRKHVPSLSILAYTSPSLAFYLCLFKLYLSCTIANTTLPWLALEIITLLQFLTKSWVSSFFLPPSLYLFSGIKYTVEPINAGHSTEVKKIQVECISSVWPVKQTLKSPPLQPGFCMAAIWLTLVLCLTVLLCISGWAMLILFHSLKDDLL